MMIVVVSYYNLLDEPTLHDPASYVKQHFLISSERS